ncbi:DEAD/DEAH box helicase [Paenibacillus cremeus]|uniref:DEAD/DEAH box helicase n=1 Tax=Paenibacillus cremeus TaxID=2163881 RepID=A0A559KA58_9BACL|nr:DEAD/DEAH box helicase [Paenibacillus cremeus]TVY09017.1 DEAD/DEAH box helicase [Paenibacillus cremeus]
MIEPELAAFHPLLATWFGEVFGAPTDVQKRAWKAIRSGAHTLIAAPTGSGKTLAALLACLNEMLEAKLQPGSEAERRGVKLLYITPLKALNNDIHHHVVEFVRQLESTAAEQGAAWPGLTVGVRTGDTPQRVRAAMLRQPPDVLVITPESLYIMLTSMKGREILRTVRYAIIDEIHDLAADRRGLHLSVTLERLTVLCGASPRRIGVSATQKPIERVAEFLGGWELEGGESEGRAEGKAECETERRLMRRSVEIIESRMDKTFRVSVTMPEQTIISQDKQEAVWAPLTDKLMKLMSGSRSVLVFVNNRRLCERLTLRLNEHAGYEMARSHHGSVSREQRLEVERALKAGELRCLVATSSLELGIDVGHIDLVLQIDSPKSAAAGIQRIGRAGHAVGDESRGIIVARSRGLLPECAVLARSIAARDIEDIRIPRASLDVLCQQVVAMVATEDWTLERLHGVLSRSYGYQGFPRERLEAVLRVLAGFYPFVRPLLDWDRDTGLLTRRSSTAMAAIMGAGTIPQGSAYPVHHADSRIHLGELDEEYIHESRVGDVFQLGTGAWKIQSIRSDRVYVVEAGSHFSEIPFWRGEGQGRSVAFSAEMGRFWEELDCRTETEPRQETMDWLMSGYYLDGSAAEELVTLIHSQKAVSVIPTHRRIVIEQFQDDLKQHHLVIHSLFGKTFNRTWLLAVQTELESRLPYRLYTSAKDNGIVIVVSDGGSGDAAARLLPMLREVTADRLEALLRQAVPTSPLFGAAFRRLAETSLLLSRSFTRMPSWQKRLRSEELLRESLPYAEQFPFLGEAMRLCLQEELDAEHVKDVLRQMEAGQLAVVLRQSGYPSPFAAQFTTDAVQAQMYESDAVSRDLQAQLIGLDRSLAGKLFGETAVRELLGYRAGVDAEAALGAYADDAAAVGGYTEEGEGLSGELAAPSEAPVGDLRPAAITSSEGLVRYLKRRGEMSSAEVAGAFGDAVSEEWLTQATSEGKLCSVQLGGEERWIVRDEAETYAALPADPMAVRFVLTRFMERGMDFTAATLCARYGLERALVAPLLEVWAAERRIEPSPLTLEVPGWLSARAAARRVRSRVAELQGRAAPVNPARYCSRLLQLQHVSGADRLSEEEGLRKVIATLQGLFLPLSQWEGSVFPLRLSDYRKETLDRLCAAGDVLWVGRKEADEREGRVAFFLAEAKELYAPLLPSLEMGEDWSQKAKGDKVEQQSLSAEREKMKVLGLLERKGASFLTALSRDTDRLPSELTSDLIGLAWEGLVSCDQFAPLRMHGGSAAGKGKRASLGAGAKAGSEGARSSYGRAAGASRSKSAGFQSGLGRWYALRALAEDDYDARASLAAWVKHLLGSFGMLTKEIAAAHLPWSWDEVYATLKQLEQWGMLTRGLWVEDVPTLQFSTPQLVEALRHPQGWDADASRVVLLPSTDPANPFGFSVQWPSLPGTGVTFARKSGNELVIRGGRWLLWVENGGKRMYTLHELAGVEEAEWLSPDELCTVLKAVVQAQLRMPGVRKLIVDRWNGVPVRESSAAEVFVRLGAEADRQSFVIWPSSLL